MDEKNARPREVARHGRGETGIRVRRLHYFLLRQSLMASMTSGNRSIASLTDLMIKVVGMYDAFLNLGGGRPSKEADVFWDVTSPYRRALAVACQVRTERDLKCEAKYSRHVIRLAWFSYGANFLLRMREASFRKS